MMKDKEVWEHYTRSLDPLTKQPRRKIIKAAPTPDKNEARHAAAKHLVKAAALLASNPLPDITLEKRREKSLRQGEIDIDAKIDLHGMTQVEAYDALAAFMTRIAKNGKRHLLIITGKGRGGAGVLRTKLRDWLGQLPQAASILVIRPASIKHGGDGAFYVVMRKK